jgi:hypothetical protein
LRKRNKRYLFEWLVDADFTKEVSIMSLMDADFEIEEDGQRLKFDPPD